MLIKNYAAHQERGRPVYACTSSSARELTTPILVEGIGGVERARTPQDPEPVWSGSACCAGSKNRRALGRPAGSPVAAVYTPSLPQPAGRPN